MKRTEEFLLESVLTQRSIQGLTIRVQGWLKVVKAFLE